MMMWIHCSNDDVTVTGRCLHCDGHCGRCRCLLCRLSCCRLLGSCIQHHCQYLFFVSIMKKELKLVCVCVSMRKFVFLFCILMLGVGCTLICYLVFVSNWLSNSVHVLLIIIIILHFLFTCKIRLTDIQHSLSVSVDWHFGNFSRKFVWK